MQQLINITRSFNIKYLRVQSMCFGQLIRAKLQYNESTYLRFSVKSFEIIILNLKYDQLKLNQE